jgi:hypothetical protein
MLLLFLFNRGRLFNTSFLIGCEEKVEYILRMMEGTMRKQTNPPAIRYLYYKGEDDFYKRNPLPGPEYFYNPILPGWYSDPSICTNGEDYFLVTSTFTYFPGVPIFHSRDLVNWKQIGHVLDRPSQLVNMQGQHVSGGIFAPAIEYNPQTNYYMNTRLWVPAIFL